MRLPSTVDEAILWNNTRKAIGFGDTFFDLPTWPEPLSYTFYAGARGPRNNKERFTLARWLINNGLDPKGTTFKKIVSLYVKRPAEGKSVVAIDERPKVTQHLKQIRTMSENPDEWEKYSDGYHDLNEGRYYKMSHNT